MSEFKGKVLQGVETIKEMANGTWVYDINYPNAVFTILDDELTRLWIPSLDIRAYTGENGSSLVFPQFLENEYAIFAEADGFRIKGGNLYVRTNWEGVLKSEGQLMISHPKLSMTSIYEDSLYTFASILEVLGDELASPTIKEILSEAKWYVRKKEEAK